MKCREPSFSAKAAPRAMVRGKRWLLLSSWVNLDRGKRRQLNALFALNRRILKAYLLKESLSQLWNYTYEGALLRYLQSWIDQLRAAAETDGEAGPHVAGSLRES
jgi:hypothetical protein